MALPNDQLFLDRFIAFNTNRYKDEQRIVDVLTSLTLDNIEFSNFRKVTLESGDVRHLVDVDSTSKLTGDDQEYTPADYVKNKTATLVEPDPLELDALKRKGVQGIYFLGLSAEETVGAVLVYNGSKTIENIKAQIKEKCLYELSDSDIIVAEDLTFVTIDSRTITGVVEVVESLYDDIPRYNGQFRADGTIRAL